MENILKVLGSNGDALKDVENQTEEFCLRAVAQKGSALQYVKDQTPLICAVAVDSDPNALQYAKYQPEKLCIAAVRFHGKALKYVRHQIHAICMAAVKNWGSALQYVKEQDAEICSAAVEQWEDARAFVRNPDHIIQEAHHRAGAKKVFKPYEFTHIEAPDEKACIDTLKAFGYGLQYMTSQTKKMCLAAVLKDGESYRHSRHADEEAMLAAVMDYPRILYEIKRPPLLLCIAAALFSYDQPRLTRFLTSDEKQWRREALCFVRNPEIRRRLKHYLQSGWNYRHLVETEMTLPDD